MRRVFGLGTDCCSISAHERGSARSPVKHSPTPTNSPNPRQIRPLQPGRLALVAAGLFGEGVAEASLDVGLSDLRSRHKAGPQRPGVNASPRSSSVRSPRGRRRGHSLHQSYGGLVREPFRYTRAPSMSRAAPPTECRTVSCGRFRPRATGKRHPHKPPPRLSHLPQTPGGCSRYALARGML
jgi:hypothetical protein